MTKSSIGKFVVFAGWVALVGALYLFLQSTAVPLRDYPEYIRMAVDGFGVFGPIVYIALYTVRTLTFFSATVFTVASGLIFGPALGMLYTVIALNLSTLLAFFVGRYFGESVVARAGHRVKFFPKGEKFRNHGFMTVLLMRLLFFPFDWVGYLAGAYNLRVRDVFLGTLIGTLPGMLAFVFLGGAFHNPLTALPLFVIFFVFGLVIAKLLKKTDHGQVLEKIKKEGE